MLISSLFTRFLAEQTGSNFASGLSKKLTDLKSELEKNKSEMVQTKIYLEGRINVAIGKADKALVECGRPKGGG